MKLELAEKSKTILEGDSGVFEIPASGSEYALQLFSFRLEADRFTKGSLKITASGMFSVYVNGEVKKEKKSTGVKDTELELTLLPAHLYNISIKYLNEKADTLSNELHLLYSNKTGKAIPTLTSDKPYNFTAMMTGRSVTGASISADGRFTLIHYSDVSDKGSSLYYTHLVYTDTGRLITEFIGDRSGVAWMPASTRLYYTVERDGNKKLITLDPVTLQEESIAEGLPKGSLTFSREESYLICSVPEEGPKEDAEVQQVLNMNDRIAGWRTRYLLHKYDLSTGILQPLTYGYRNTTLQDIRPDGRSILFTNSQTDYTKRPYTSNSLYQMDLETLEVDTIWKDNRFTGTAQFSPDGKRLLISGAAEAFGQIGLHLPPGAVSNTYDRQLFLMDIATREVEALTRSFDPSVSWSQWHTDNYIYLLAEERDYRNLYRLDPDKGTFEQLPAREEYIYAVSLRGNSGKLLYQGEGVRNYNRLHVLDLKKQRSVCLSDPSAERLENVRLAEVKEWDFVSDDHTTITGRYYLPPGFDPGQKYPLIVYYYGGTSPTGRTLNHPYSMQVFAAQGYVVYVLQPSGTTGFGQEFSSRHVNAWGKRTAEDIIAGTTQFIEEHPFIDKERIGCIGASYGGFMTQYLQTRTDLFAAAVSHAGISNIASYWGEGYWGFGYNQVAAADSYPWNNPELYVEQSPLFSADKIHTPLLFLHGADDTNVPVGESIQMFQALKILGKETAFIKVNGEDHGIRRFDRRMKWNHAIHAWFARWLKDQPEWWEELFPEKDL